MILYPKFYILAYYANAWFEMYLKWQYLYLIIALHVFISCIGLYLNIYFVVCNCILYILCIHGYCVYMYSISHPQACNVKSVNFDRFVLSFIVAFDVVKGIGYKKWLQPVIDVFYWFHIDGYIWIPDFDMYFVVL